MYNIPMYWIAVAGLIGATLVRVFASFEPNNWPEHSIWRVDLSGFACVAIFILLMPLKGGKLLFLAVNAIILTITGYFLRLWRRKKLAEYDLDDNDSASDQTVSEPADRTLEMGAKLNLALSGHKWLFLVGGWLLWAFALTMNAAIRIQQHLFNSELPAFSALLQRLAELGINIGVGAFVLSAMVDIGKRDTANARIVVLDCVIVVAAIYIRQSVIVS